MRAREGHSGPHAPHFWDAETAGGGALLDMGCHTVESARHFFGKDNPVTEVWAWGATLVHGDKTTGEDTAVAMLKFAGGQMATIESSWIEKGGMQLRHEFVGSAGRLVTDSSATPVWGFIQNPVGYLVEKADAETGWVYPVPEEARAYGFSQQFRHFVTTFERGRAARRDLRGRLHRQLHPRRLLPLDEVGRVGEGRDRVTSPSSRPIRVTSARPAVGAGGRLDRSRTSPTACCRPARACRRSANCA